MADEKKPNPWPALLKAWRKERGLSQSRAAAVAGVSYQAWASWERGICPPSELARNTLANRCGLRMSEPQIA